MIKTITLALAPADAADSEYIRRIAAEETGFSGTVAVRIRKRSIDARSKSPKIILELDVFSGERPPVPVRHTLALREVSDTSLRVIIIGAGPAGYFAALQLLEHGIKPIVIERGKDVRERRRDLRAIQQFSAVNPHSNYCFGEGGAGTYSDGKLYTNATKRGNIRKVLEMLVEHGAQSDILIDTHPHIGSNKLPDVVGELRNTIIKYGGEVHFNHHITDFTYTIQHDDSRKIAGVIAGGAEFTGAAVILATGHSARDIFKLLYDSNILIEAKPFALGVRVEHPQMLIDEIRYRQRPRNEYLPAASYKLVTQINGRGVFSFCMCPGGLIVPAATAPGEIVINGMSMSRRDSRFANSGVVVAIEPSDVAERFASAGELATLAYQRDVEQRVFRAGDGTQRAPAQRLTDFISGKASSSLPETSYIPGIFNADVASLFDETVSSRLRAAMADFNRQMRGYITQEAIVVATESRSSSPVRIPRSKETLQHPTLAGLFPCGEGAGYAGGIMSAAIDGQNVANAVAAMLNP